MLELGGTDVFVVMPSADVAKSAEFGANSRTQNSGQSCICAKRFYVHEDVYDAWFDAFLTRMQSMKPGDPFADGTSFGPMATEQVRAEAHELVEDAKANGVTVHTGGELPDGPGWFYPATVLTGVTPEMRIYREECFGPVACVYKVASIDEAIALSNDSEFGLAASRVVDRPGRDRPPAGRARVRRGVRERQHGVVLRPAVRRRQGLGLRARARRVGHPRVREREDGVDGVGARGAIPLTTSEGLSPFRRRDAGARHPVRRNLGFPAAHAALHLAMAGIMAISMLGPHSPGRILVAAAALLVVAMALAPAARSSAVVRAHVLDCFAMAIAMLCALSTRPLDEPTLSHPHGAGIPIPSLATLALVAAGWAAARVTLLLLARTGRRTSLAGAALTAVGFALMAAMA